MLMLFSATFYGCSDSKLLRCDVFSHTGSKKTVLLTERTQRVVKEFRWYDMGGSSDNLRSLTTGLVSPRDFKFTPVDTKQPKVRVIRNVICVHVTVIMDANDDTGNDFVEVRDINGVLLFSSEIKEFFERREFDLNFLTPRDVIFRVSNNSMPNNTPGAFGLTILMRGYFARYHRTYSSVRIAR